MTVKEDEDAAKEIKENLGEHGLEEYHCLLDEFQDALDRANKKCDGLSQRAVLIVLCTIASRLFSNAAELGGTALASRLYGVMQDGMREAYDYGLLKHHEKNDSKH